MSPATADDDAAPEDTAPEGSAPDEAGRRPRWRTVAAWLATALAGLLVLVALILPTRLSQLTPGAFLRIPVEGLLGVALVLVLPPRVRRLAVVLGGAVLGLLTI